MTAAAGFLAGASWGARRGADGERASPDSAAFAGALAGLFAAAVGYAVIQSLELPLGSWSASPLAAIAFWAVLGLALAAPLLARASASRHNPDAPGPGGARTMRPVFMPSEPC